MLNSDILRAIHLNVRAALAPLDLKRQCFEPLLPPPDPSMWLYSGELLVEVRCTDESIILTHSLHSHFTRCELYLSDPNLFEKIVEFIRPCAELAEHKYD